MKETNETDLHIQFKLETATYHSYSIDNFDDSNFTTAKAYKATYTEWLEEKLLKQINK